MDTGEEDRMRVLVVEDERRMAAALRRGLQAESFVGDQRGATSAARSMISRDVPPEIRALCTAASRLSISRSTTTSPTTGRRGYTWRGPATTT